MTADSSNSPSVALRVAGVLLGLGAVCLGAKAGAILLTGDQPPVLFAVAGLPLGLGLLLISRWSVAQHGRSKMLFAAAALSFVAAVASAYKALREILSKPLVEPLESILAVSGGLVPVIAALLVGLRLRTLNGLPRRIGQRCLLVATMFLPLMVLGGIAAALAGERYLEVGLLLIAAVWSSLAWSVVDAR